MNPYNYPTIIVVLALPKNIESIFKIIFFFTYTVLVVCPGFIRQNYGNPRYNKPVTLFSKAIIYDTKYCHLKIILYLHILLTGSVRPFRLSFHTNAVEMPNDMGNRGFCLNYIQQPCNANYP